MKKHIKHVITCLVLLVCVNLNAQQYIYAVPIEEVSPTGGDGTIDDPWDLQTGLDNILPGQTLYLRDGTYHGRFNTFNTPNSTDTTPKKITSYPGEWARLDGNVNGLGNEFGNGATLTVTKPYMWFMNFEITFLGDYSRATEYEVGNGCVKNCNGAINHHAGIQCKFINLIISEHPGNGIWTTKASGGVEIYGCLIFNNGNEDPTQALGTPDDGSGIYSQNSTDFWDRYSNNLFFNNFKVGAKMYSDSRDGGSGGPADYIKNLYFEDNTILNSGSPLNPVRGRECFIVGSNSRVQGRAIPHHIDVRRNFMYHNRGSIGVHAEALRIGQQLVGGSGPLNGPNFYGNYAHHINIEDNYIIGRAEGLRLIRVGGNFNFKRNIVSTGYVFSRKNLDYMNSNNWHFEDNTYFTKYETYSGEFCENRLDDCRFNCPRTMLFFFKPAGYSGKRTLEEMRESNPGCYQVESNDPLHLSIDLPYGDLNEWIDTNLENSIDGRKTISIVQNFYNPNRFKIVAYQKASNGIIPDVIADLSSYGIPEGTPFTIRDGENYSDVIEDYGGNIGPTREIKLPMGLTILDIPDGYYPSKAAGTQAKKSNPEVGVFIVDFGGIDCTPDFVFQDETETGTVTHEAGNSITTAGSGTYFDVESGADVTHQAGNYVLLQAGTHIKQNSNYLAKIEACITTELEYVGETYPESRKSITKTKENDKVIYDIKVAPNPATNKIAISSSEVMSYLVLSNTLGRTLLEMNVNQNSSKNAELNLSNVPSGLYFLHVTLTNGEVVTKQVIKK